MIRFLLRFIGLLSLALAFIFLVYDGTKSIADQTLYRWRRQFGSMEVSEVKRLRALQRENAELKRLVGELTLDNRMLKDVLGKNW